MTTDTAPVPHESALNRLTTGRTAFDFIGRSRQFLLLTIAVLAVCALALLIRRLDFGIDFTGGTSFTVTNTSGDVTSEEVRSALEGAGVTESIVQIVDGGEGVLVSTPALEEIGGIDQDRLVDALAAATGATAADVDVSAVGPRWGAQVTRQALQGLVVFLALVILYITLRFEWRMAVAAVLTLLHDVFVTVGLYALIGFEVTPASIIAFLTILGYSLYDTVVVFDRINENTEGLSSVSTSTYGEVANQSLNQVLVRSLSTSITSILPVTALLVIGSTVIGGETLQDLALALFIGMVVGVYSSVVVAAPLLVFIKEREPKLAELKERVRARRGESTTTAPGAAAGQPGPSLAKSGPAPRPRRGNTPKSKRR